MLGVKTVWPTHTHGRATDPIGTGTTAAVHIRIAGPSLPDVRPAARTPSFAESLVSRAGSRPCRQGGQPPVSWQLLGLHSRAAPQRHGYGRAIDGAPWAGQKTAFQPGPTGVARTARPYRRSCPGSHLSRSVPAHTPPSITSRCSSRSGDAVAGLGPAVRGDVHSLREKFVRVKHPFPQGPRQLKLNRCVGWKEMAPRGGQDSALAVTRTCPCPCSQPAACSRKRTPLCLAIMLALRLRI